MLVIMTLKQYLNSVRGKIGNKKNSPTKMELCSGENAYRKGLLELLNIIFWKSLAPR